MKLSSEAKTLTNEDYQENTRRLNQDIDYYKKMYIKSLKALTKIEKIMTLEKCKFETERKVYEEQIKRLKNRV